tara:strand:- start:1070 stop:1450 length:381 start_codon:yes stop_codon:yes gene_type:complete
MRANARREGAFRGSTRRGVPKPQDIGTGWGPDTWPPTEPSGPTISQFDEPGLTEGPGACPTGMKVGPRPDGTMGCVPDNEGGRPITPPRDPGLGRRGPGGRRGRGRNVMGSTIGGRDWGRRGRGNK